MPAFSDLTGRVFGKLTVIDRAEDRIRSGKRMTIWNVRCECGTVKSVRAMTLVAGKSKSCGCVSNVAHGHARNHHESATYKTWKSMIGRCYHTGNASYPEYGGAGITVCARWHTFENFLADMGIRPEGMSIDRIDNDRGYEPGNCRWATGSEQALNRRPRRWARKPKKGDQSAVTA